MLDYDFENSAGFWIMTAAHDYERAFNDELAPEGITLRQCQVLGFLALAGPLAQNELAERMRRASAGLTDHPHVAEVRQTGMILAIEMVRERATGERYDWRERRGLRAYEYALAQGALLRPLGNVIYLMPPYVIEPEQIDWLAVVARGAVDAACG